MSWFKRLTGLVGRDKAPTSATEPTPERELRPAAPRPAAGLAAASAARPVPAQLAAKAAASRAAAATVRKAEAAAAARAVLSSLGVAAPIPAPKPQPLLSADRQALITEAMRHWAAGHAIYQRLDPGLKERVRAVAERMAPK